MFETPRRKGWRWHSGEVTQQDAVPSYPLHCPHPRPFRELTKSGFHNRVAPSNPTVTTRSSDPSWPADKIEKLSQEKGRREQAAGTGRWLTFHYLHWAPGQLHSG